MPPRTILETYDYLRRIAPELSGQFRADAARSHNEEEFRSSNATHRQLSALSQRAHELAPAARGGDAAAQAELRQVEAQVDVAAAKLWGLTDDEVAEIRRSLAELGQS
jgi:hypothetical protein